MTCRKLASVLVIGLLSETCTGVLSANDVIVFNTTRPENHLQGTFAAEVLFAQSQIVPSRPREGDRQPHLMSRRRCLVMVRPLDAENKATVQVTAVDRRGDTLGTIDLDPPEKLPKTAYFMEGLPQQAIDFRPQTDAVAVIRTTEDLKKLHGPQAAFLSERLEKKRLIEIETADGRWVRDIHLPEDAAFDGKFVRLHSQAGYRSTVHYGDRTAVLSRGQTLLLKSIQGRWISADDAENQRLIYAAATWSGVLPAAWVNPGVSLRFRQGEVQGRLTELEVGPPTELILHTIDLGMLVPPLGRFRFAADPSAQREYFQTVPVSRMVVSQYAPVFLRRVMLPNGTFLVNHDPGKGDWHHGTMRQRIGKELISHGINNANYGVHSTAGEGEGGHLYLTAQLTAHMSTGRYSNGIVTHGGSGGGGIVTLDKTLGNELSHEVGHNYGLGHYVGGFRGSVHRAADQVNSTWGWDADQQRFIPNFSPTRSGKATCLGDACQQPFFGRSFGLDAMAGGSPFSAFNRFTLYTPYTAATIQEFLERKAVFAAESPTGFHTWDAARAAMVPYAHRVDVGATVDASPDDLTAEKLASLVAEYDLVKVAMRDGRWIKNVRLPAATAANRGRTVRIDQGATYDSFLNLGDKVVKMPSGFKQSYTSDGSRWREGPSDSQQIDRTPEAFGVPVTTLVGYYDPRNELVSYIYPALHGAYGFVYGDDRERVSDDQGCSLVVETREGTLQFRLANQRINPQVMNKFHVNVPESSRPVSVAVVCRGKVVDRRTIAGVTDPPVVTVHGE